MAELWVIGFLISVLGSFFATLGLNLQKYVHLKLAKEKNASDAPELTDGSEPKYWSQPLWAFGTILMAVDSVMDLITFGLAPQSLLAPLAALTLVYNAFLAPYFLKEKLHRIDIIATVVIFVGAIIVVYFSNHNTPDYDLKQLMDLYYRLPVYTYFFCLLGYMSYLFLSIRFIERTYKDEAQADLESGRNSRTSNASAKSTTSLKKFYVKLHPFAYASLAGALGGTSALFAKSVVELIKDAFKGGDSFKYFQTYVLIFALIACLSSQLHFLNTGLQKFDALYIVPVYQVFWIIVGTLGGEIYFDEFADLATINYVMFPVGCAITLTGIWLLSQRPQEQEDEESLRRDSLFDNVVTPGAAVVGGPRHSIVERRASLDRNAAQKEERDREERTTREREEREERRAERSKASRSRDEDDREDRRSRGKKDKKDKKKKDREVEMSSRSVRR